MLGSEPPPGAGSVMANADRTLPSTIGRSHFSFCAGVPSFLSTFMLPSSGAMQLKASGPKTERAASSYITAQATIGRSMPPSSFGDCGAHRPAALALTRTGSSRASGMFSCSEKFAGSDSSGSTCSSTKARVRTRRFSISGGNVKSLGRTPEVGRPPSAAQPHHLPGVDHDGGTGHVGAGVRGEQQQRAVEIAVLTETADRDVARHRPTLLAFEVPAIDLGHKPAWGDGVDAHATERELEA